MLSFSKYSILFFTLLLPATLLAQGTLFLTPSTGSYEVGESFSVLINVNTGGGSINAAAGQLNFDNAKLQVVSLGYSQSIFNLWTENPTFSNPAGSIVFSGGVPSPGFTGASGGVLRVTFLVKAPGQAPVNFLSGSILANDGQGTNIADGLRGGLYTLSPANPSSPTPVVRPEPPVTSLDKPIEVPTITKAPEELPANSTLTLEGLGIPLSKIFLIIQKGLDEPVKEYTFTGPDGKFIFTYTQKVESGYYRIWARNVTDSGNESGLSDPVTIEVTAPTFMRLGILALDYATIILTLLALLVLALILLLALWSSYRKSKKRKGHEISEAEDKLHESFDTMKEGLSNYITYLGSAKTVSGMKKREQKTKNELKEQLDDIESKVRKEIEDIDK